ncbi:MAG: SemiSWEET transporter [Deltaproteobacteria bacterium]|nr:SemiSWEET transporter [Deltaproteobacteria bacterium]
MEYAEIIGLVAGFLTTFAFLPQVFKTIRTKSTTDFSIIWISTLTFGILLWLVFGILSDNLPIILANAASLFLAGIILVYKLIYK